MNFLDLTRSPASIALLVQCGKDEGIDSADLLRGCKLSDQHLNNPNIEVSAAQEIRVAQNLLRLSQSKSQLGLKLGQRYKPSVYGMWGFGLISSATVEDAMRHAMRFLPLTFIFSTIRFRNDGELLHLQFDEANFNDDLKKFLLHRDMSAAFVLLKSIIGEDFSLQQMTLRQAAHEVMHKSEFEKLFEIVPSFGAHSNSLVFSAQIMKKPLPLANPTAANMCDQLCAELLEKRRSKLGTTAIVKQYLGMNLYQIPRLKEMANLFNTSERTLKRMLASENTSFRQLVKEFQCTEAIDYLTNSHLKISEIATQLGFSDASSFSQSFKRWTGIAPINFREAQGDEQADEQCDENL